MHPISRSKTRGGVPAGDDGADRHPGGEPLSGGTLPALYPRWPVIVMADSADPLPTGAVRLVLPAEKVQVYGQPSTAMSAASDSSFHPLGRLPMTPASILPFIFCGNFNPANILPRDNRPAAFRFSTAFTVLYRSRCRHGRKYV